MPLVQHSDLPTFQRLKDEGRYILPSARALQQDIRELHIGFLNMMPDAALEATERQFFRLVGESNRVAQIYMHPFTMPGLKRSPEAAGYIARHYSTFDQLRKEGLDALVITGANEETNPNVTDEEFWAPLREVLEWAHDNVASTLCSCLASHAAVHYRYGQKPGWRDTKQWGVYAHRIADRTHPLVRDTNTIFNLPHSRYSEIRPEQFRAAGMNILVESPEAGVHMATSSDGFRLICFQGHPEYDAVSLLKEYRREVMNYAAGEREDYPPFPEHYFNDRAQDILNAYRELVFPGKPAPEFPEKLIEAELEDTWRDSAKAVIGAWIGAVYQVTHIDRKKQFMDGIDPEDPLGLRSAQG